MKNRFLNICCIIMYSLSIFVFYLFSNARQQFTQEKNDLCILFCKSLHIWLVCAQSRLRKCATLIIWC